MIGLRFELGELCVEYMKFGIRVFFIIFSFSFVLVSDLIADWVEVLGKIDTVQPYVHYNRGDAEVLDVGVVKLGGEIDINYVSHKLGSGWVIMSDVDNGSGLNKLYDYSYRNPFDWGKYSKGNYPERLDDWSGEVGSRMLLNLGMRPFEWFFADVGVEIFGGYASRFWIPVNNGHRLEYNGDKFDWSSAKIGFVYDSASLVYYRNHYRKGWENDGDLFDLFPSDYIPDNFLRYSGEHTPEYVQLKSAGIFGDIEVSYGIEALQNFFDGVYLKYRKIFGSRINLFYTDHRVKFGNPDNEKERMRNLEINTSFNLGIGELEVGGLYRPFRVGWQYQYAEGVGGGSGVDGSDFIVKTGVTSDADAFGGGMRFTIPLKRFIIDNIVLGGEYRGYVAGNRWKARASFEKYLKTLSANVSLGWFYQKPLMEAMPTIATGDGEGPIDALNSRAWESPFWVWWRNPLTGFDNRETNAFSLVYTYDPTPETWFYGNDANVPGLHNLNPSEDAVFSFAMKLNFAKYSGRLDRQLIWTYDGSARWEDFGMFGTAGTGYLGSFYMLSQFIHGKFKFVHEFEVGEDVATLDYSYSNRETFLVPIINYLKTSITIDVLPYVFRAEYRRNYWGPEDWHKQFGLTYDNLYLFHISRDFGKHFNFGVEYIEAQKTDKWILYQIDGVEKSNNELGTFSEINVFFKIYFGATIVSGRPLLPPSVDIHVGEEMIMPEKGQTAAISSQYIAEEGIKNWTIYISASDNTLVRTYSGDASNIGRALAWDAKDSDGNIVPEGEYKVVMKLQDNRGVSAVSNVEYIKTMPAPDIEGSQIEETDEGIKILMKSAVLFDTDKYALKPAAVKALSKVVEFLNFYKNRKILITGHTDSRASLKYNQVLSKNRANSVAKFLKNNGLKNALEIIGHGETMPIASNQTVIGRAKNRRVEITALKDKHDKDVPSGKDIKEVTLDLEVGVLDDEIVDKPDRSKNKNTAAVKKSGSKKAAGKTRAAGAKKAVRKS
jgi:outer membrane protein OmpA-like peptidoglycan-associated protein